jgi:hypothetical protein
VYREGGDAWPINAIAGENGLGRARLKDGVKASSSGDPPWDRAAVPRHVGDRFHWLIGPVQDSLPVHELDQ